MEKSRTPLEKSRTPWQVRQFGSRPGAANYIGMIDYNVRQIRQRLTAAH
jgi:hypothetical protein